MPHDSTKIPITLLVDDSCPLIHVYRNHWVDVHGRLPQTEDGRPLLEFTPNAFLDRFCAVVERWEMAGKFSIVPAPGGLGDIVHGIEGFDPGLTREWLDTALARLGARFDFCPEGITHNLAVDLKSGAFLDAGESVWSQTQDRTSLTPYLVRELELLKAAGIPASGITSCWTFGQKVEAEYIAAMVAAQKAVNGLDFGWYFLHIWHRYPHSRTYVAFAEGKTVLVSINSTVDDFFWGTINSPRTDAEYIHSAADQLLSADGKQGAIREVIDAGGWPVLMTHWQSFFSNGTESGLAVLDELGRRVKKTLTHEVSWATCSELARRTAAAG